MLQCEIAELEFIGKFNCVSQGLNRHDVFLQELQKLNR